MNELNDGALINIMVKTSEASGAESVSDDKETTVDCKTNANDKDLNCRSKISLNSLTNIATNFRRGGGSSSTSSECTALRKIPHRSHSKDSLLDLKNEPSSISTKKRSKWIMKFNCAKLKCMKNPLLAENSRNKMKNKTCVCTCYRKTQDVGDATEKGAMKTDKKHSSSAKLCTEESLSSSCSTLSEATGSSELTTIDKISPTLIPERTEEDTNSQSASSNSSIQQSCQSTSDASSSSEPLYGNMPSMSCSEITIRSQDSTENVKAVQADGEKWVQIIYPPVHPEDMDEDEEQYQANSMILRHLEQNLGGRTVNTVNSYGTKKCLKLIYPADINMEFVRALFQSHFRVESQCHTQVDYVHYLVPDLQQITLCSFYWGKMDRYEAERLLDGKPEGTFLLRDSAQDDFLFSVSFRKYGRSLHARIEQWKHKFSFDSHDPGVYASDTVCGLIEHYKDPTCCMFFEPILTLPLHRNFTFSLQHLCRSMITSRLKYDKVDSLQLPSVLKMYLKEYHYRQKIRVKRFDTGEVQCVDFNRS